MYIVFYSIVCLQNMKLYNILQNNETAYVSTTVICY